MGERLTPREIQRLVNRYLGVYGGYLADFSYRTHREFYAAFCDLDINPEQYPGTTRERFIAVLSDADGRSQAAILRGVLEKYPPGSSDIRSEAEAERLWESIRRLEGDTGVSSTQPRITSETVRQAIRDAEVLIRESGAPSSVDRVHTALHGYLRAVVDEEQLAYTGTPRAVAFLTMLVDHHPKLRDRGPRADDIKRTLRALGAILDALDPMRNRASLAHPTAAMLPPPEAVLFVNAARTILTYLDEKLSA